MDMKEIFAFLLSIPWPASISLLALIVIILALLKLDKLILLLNIKNNNNSTKNQNFGDIILSFSVKREKYEFKKRLIESSILKEQMNFAEQKLSVIKFLLLESFRKKLIDVDLENQLNMVEDNKQFAIYRETLGNALVLMKDEIRRSMKENGFSKMNQNEFNEYINNQHKTILTISKNYILINYPFIGMNVKMDEFKGIEQDSITNLIYEIYERAREIKLDIDERLNELNKEFNEEIDKFIENRG